MPLPALTQHRPDSRVKLCGSFLLMLIEAVGMRTEYLGKSDYLNPIMHSALLFLLSLCIPLPTVNQGKVGINSHTPCETDPHSQKKGAFSEQCECH
ncbi:hypothetical protein STEG23_011923, partial [Scotinomys teguina]